jgi:hypothetical protein
MEKWACMDESIAMGERDDIVTLWSEMMPKALSGEPAVAERLRQGLASGFDWKALHSCVDEQLRSWPGHSVLAMRRLCRAAGLTARLQQEARESTDCLARASAALTLMRLREEVSLDMLVELLHCDEPAAVVAAAEALALSREPRFFMPVLRALCEQMPATPSAAGRLLLLFGEDICPMAHGLLKGVLRQYIDAEDPDSHCEIDRACEIDRHEPLPLEVIVDVLSGNGYRTAVPTYSRLLGVCENEALHRCLLKAVATAGDVWPVAAPPQRLAA